MDRDHGVRFTDEVYATKDDVKKTLNISSIDSIWDRICLYRSYYLKQIPLRSIERIPFSVCYFNRMNINLISLEKKLSHCYNKYSRLHYEAKEQSLHFEFDQYKKIALAYAEAYGINISENTLNAIVSGSVDIVPVEYLSLDRYIKTLKYYSHRYAGNFNESFLVSIYSLLRGIDNSNLEPESLYRKNELINRSEHVLSGRHYEASPVNKIKEMMDMMFNYNNSDTSFSVINAISSAFMIMYVKPFDDFNIETSLVYAKAVLAHFDNGEISYLLPLEKLLNPKEENEIKKVMLESEMKNDLTYLIEYLMPKLMELVNEMAEELEKVNANIVVNEQYELPVSNQSIDSEVIKEEVPTSLNLNFEKKVSLPTMPVGLDDKDVMYVANHLVELYPTLKKGQAEFYARHCTLGKYYTISQYKKELNCAYETARTSMDNLEMLGFYKKEIIKNKFVYTPVVRE